MTMYDRLGEALRDALEKGSIPHNESTERRSAKVPPVDKGGEGRPAYTQWMKRSRVARTQRAGRVLQTAGQLPYGKVLHNDASMSGASGGVAKPYSAPSLDGVPPEVKAAYAALGLEMGASLDEIKAAWREKIKMFHPDSNSGNEVVQRVAQKKTLEVMAAYKVLLAFCGQAVVE